MQVFIFIYFYLFLFFCFFSEAKIVEIHYTSGCFTFLWASFGIKWEVFAKNHHEWKGSLPNNILISGAKYFI